MADELTEDGLEDPFEDEEEEDDDSGGEAHAHPESPLPVIFVGPATAAQHNTIEERIRPVACWRLDDTRFEFDSSFVKPEAARELRLLAEARGDHPGATLSIFGHADPTGDEEYNKTLSGRRARAIYGLLTRDADEWESLYKPPVGGDNWGKPSLAVMLATVGRDPAEAESGMTVPARKELYLQYMNQLCGPDLQLDPTADFLARGADAKRRGDVQGCSEFNALLRFSKKEQAELSQFKNKAKRDTENLPNRRVVAYLFEPTLVVDPGEWPCPAATDPTKACRKRFFSDHVKRRDNQEARREFAKDKDTFECRFYHRLAIESPCEESVVTSLQRLRVRLRLVYLDPLGKERNFPKGIPVTAVCLDGTTKQAKVGDNGLVRFVIERSKQSFTLEFATEDLYLAAASPGVTLTPLEKMLTEEEVEDAARQGYFAFKLPKAWKLEISDWPTVESPQYNRVTHSFENFESPAVRVGTPASPVRMVLDPHWQYVRFVYFDRFAKVEAEPPALFVNGFELAANQDDAPDTRSNWKTARNQALPWIRRDRPRPDKDVLLAMDTDGMRTYVETKPDKSRKIVTVEEGGGPDTVTKDIVDKPSVDRLRFYDLPSTWKSRGYFARLAPGNAGFFETMAEKPTSDGQPLVFSLDDVILTTPVRDPVAWNPRTDRVAIFSNKLHEGIDKGLHRPDPDAPYLSLVPTVVTDRNYLADYPAWTRLIVMRGNLYDVFDRRTLDSADGVVGARAGIQWIDLTARGGPPNAVVPGPAVAPSPASARFAMVQNFFSQDHPNRGRIGRADHAILRCCDVVGGDEIAVNLHYFRFRFDFSPAPIPSRNTQPTTIAAPGKDFVNSAVRNVMKRWNGVDGEHHPGDAALLPADPGVKLKVRPLWFVQAFPQPLTAAFVAAEVQFVIDVFKKVRAFMGAGQGRGAIEETENAPEDDGLFALAHECGHADSMEDEYIETSNHASYGEPGFQDFIPGSPFFADGRAMMKGNRTVRPRHYWHAAEWLRTLYNAPFMVQHDGFVYRLPPHPQAPDRTFVTSPWQEARNTPPVGGAGRFDAFLFRLGREPFSFTILNKGPFDGFLSLVVKMKCTFPHNDHDDLEEQVSDIRKGIQARLNGKFFATGTVNGQAFTKIRLSFSPRFLVNNNSGDAAYLRKVGVTATRTYAQVVAGVDTRFGKHHDVTFTEDGSSGFTVSSGGTGTLTFNMDDLDLEDDFPRFFAGLMGVDNTGSALDLAASWVPIVRTVIPNGNVQRLV